MTEDKQFEDLLSGLPDSRDVLLSAIRRLPSSDSVAITGALAGRTERSVLLSAGGRFLELQLDAIETITPAAGAGSGEGKALTVVVTRPDAAVIVSRTMPAAQLAGEGSESAGAGSMPFALS